MAALLTDRGGRIETLYVMEISPAAPLDVGMEVETARALGCLEEARLIGKGWKREFLPAYLKTRQAGKAIIEHGTRKGFDLLIFDLQPGERLRRSYRKLAETLQEKAGCGVLVIAGDRGEEAKP